MTSIPITSDLGSRVTGVVPPSEVSWVIPSLLESSGVSVGGVMHQFFYPQRSPSILTRTLTLAGIRSYGTDFDAKEAMRQFLNVGERSVGAGDLVCLTADGRAITLFNPCYVGGAISAMNMGGSIYWQLMSNHCGMYLAITDPTHGEGSEKSAAGNPPTEVPDSVPLPVSITFSDNVSNLTVHFGNSVDEAGTVSSNFFITQIQIQISSLEMDLAAQFMPFGLELWACTPTMGYPAEAYPQNLAEMLLARGGEPLVVNAQMLRELGRSPDWMSYGITPPGVDVGILNGNSYWQESTCLGKLYAKISVTVSGYFTEPSTAISIWKQLQSYETGVITFDDPASGEELASYDFASIRSSNMTDNIGVAAGKPVIAGSLTFEAYTSFRV